MTEQQWTALKQMSNATNGDRWDYCGWVTIEHASLYLNFTISRSETLQRIIPNEAFEIRDREFGRTWYLFKEDNLDDFKGVSNFLRLAYKVYSDKFL